MYSSKKVELKWQKKWGKTKLFVTDLKKTKKKYYNLVMFPYPSGDKLHIGHWYSYAPADTWGRFMRMKGYNVFQPIGFDAFGLPAENYAVKTGFHPAKSTASNIAFMRKQLQRMGTMFDWSKDLDTSSPEYYRWTQWIFLQLYKNGLAYRRKAPVNWCPKCKTVLANEQVINGLCERCDAEVTKKNLTQWFFKIRTYADQLLDFTGLDWPEKTIAMQQNWIGKSKGSIIRFQLEGSQKEIEVFTTRIDTLFGATYLVLAPEHPMVIDVTTREQRKKVKKYIEKAKNITDIERTSEVRKKTGVFTGEYAINPLSGEKIPIWIADYVLYHYGTGSVMAVPAHDQRDYDFAKKYQLPIREVIRANNDKSYRQEKAFIEDGILVNCERFDGLSSEEAREKMTKDLMRVKKAKFMVNYRLKDWLISRQRYWGAPIPIIYCKKCGIIPVPENNLPVLLPKRVNYAPKGIRSPLATSKAFVQTKCPTCRKDAKREVDTMDTFVDSSWYFLRYLSPKMKQSAWDKKTVNKWLPIDMYIGGAEHACMHLLYARFLYKALGDFGFFSGREPFLRLVHQGTITKNGAKMSKSRGNVVSPDQFVDKYGSDVFRMYLMFMGPFTEGGDWKNDKGIVGIVRFVEKFYAMIDSPHAKKAPELEHLLHTTIKKVTHDIETLHFNTAIASLMEFINIASKSGLDKESKKQIVRLIAPLAPHLAEELWEKLGEKFSIFNTNWPSYDEKKTQLQTIQIVIQVNGKVRGTLSSSKGRNKDDLLHAAREIPNVKRFLAGKKAVKEIHVPDKLINFVVQ